MIGRVNMEREIAVHPIEKQVKRILNE